MKLKSKLKQEGRARTVIPFSKSVLSIPLVFISYKYGPVGNVNRRTQSLFVSFFLFFFYFFGVLPSKIPMLSFIIEVKSQSNVPPLSDQEPRFHEPFRCYHYKLIPVGLSRPILSSICCLLIMSTETNRQQYGSSRSRSILS